VEDSRIRHGIDANRRAAIKSVLLVEVIKLGWWCYKGGATCLNHPHAADVSPCEVPINHSKTSLDNKIFV
jgi:hypothetical protein